MRRMKRFLPICLCCACMWGFRVDAQQPPPPAGAVVKGAGASRTTMFRVWAPQAASVALRGDFNNWRDEPLKPEAIRAGSSHTGYWVLDAKKVRPGDKYIFRVNGQERRDPRARALDTDAKVGGGSFRVGVVVDPAAFKWDDAVKWEMPPRESLVMYELHLGAFTDDIPGRESRFSRALKRLPYLKELGINCIQLMPVNEFPGEHSWGYNPVDPYAIESSYGGAEEFRKFVQECHRNGIAVLLDIVHNHYGNAGSPQQLSMWQFDSDQGRGSYFYPPGKNADTEWGPRPNFGEQGMRDYIHGSVQMFLEEFRVDGFRWDSVHNIRYTPADNEQVNPDGDRLLMDINTWMSRAHPNALRIAEDHAFDRGGVKFDAQWNSSLRQKIADFIIAPENKRDIKSFADELTALDDFSWVVFAECHDSAGDLNNHERMPRMIDKANPDSRRARGLSLLANGIALTIPGMPMFLQGYEIHDTHPFSDQIPFSWGRARHPDHKGIVQATADLVHLRRNTKQLTPGLQGSDIFLLHADNKTQTLAYGRREKNKPRDQSTVVLYNFSGRPHKSIPIRFPSTGNWFCHYNSALNIYNAEFDNIGLKPGNGFALPPGQTLLPLDIGAYSMQVFSRVKPASASIAKARTVADPGGDFGGLDAEAASEDDGPEYSTDPLAGYIEEIIAPFPYIFVPLP